MSAKLIQTNRVHCIWMVLDLERIWYGFMAHFRWFLKNLLLFSILLVFTGAKRVLFIKITWFFELFNRLLHYRHLSAYIAANISAYLLLKRRYDDKFLYCNNIFHPNAKWEYWAGHFSFWILHSRNAHTTNKTKNQNKNHLHFLNFRREYLRIELLKVNWAT